jgi:hypothetical protein
MVRIMSSAALNERLTNYEPRKSFSIENRTDPTEQKLEADWVKECSMMKVESKFQRGRLKKMPLATIQAALRKLVLRKGDAKDRFL